MIKANDDSVVAVAVGFCGCLVGFFGSFEMENYFFFVLDLVLEHEETEVLELLKCHTFIFNKIFLII